MKKLIIILIGINFLKGVQLVGTFWPDTTEGNGGVSVQNPAIFNIDGSEKWSIFALRGVWNEEWINSGFYLGDSNWDTLVDYTIPNSLLYGNYPGQALGYINNDSFPDLVSAHPYWDSTILRVWYGGPGFDSLPDFETVYHGLHLGYSVATGDLNGDGYDEVILSTPGETNNFYREGVFVVILGGPYWDGVIDYFVWGGEDSLGFGTTVSTGDVNGDGIDDLLVGVEGWGEPPESGKVRIYYGSDSLDFSFYDAILLGADRLSPSSAKGDFNGDGYNDIVVGTWDLNNMIYFYLGGNPPDSIPDFSISNYNNYMGFGIIKDLNGDLYDELVIGFPGYENAYIYYGRDGVPSNPPDEVVNPPDYPYPGEYHYFGKDVASAGDFTGDGYLTLLFQHPLPTGWEEIHI